MKIVTLAFTVQVLHFTVGTLVGIKNDSNYCFKAALLQALYHIPIVRYQITHQESNSPVHMTLASMFTRIPLHTPSEALDMELDFIPAMTAALTEGDDMHIGAMDDAHNFLHWLIEKHMPWLCDDLFKVKMSVWFEYEGFVYGRHTEDHLGWVAKVLELDGRPVHEALLGDQEVVEIKILSTADIIEAQESQDMKEIARDRFEGLDYLPYGSNAIKFTSLVSAPPVLVIQGYKVRYSKSRQRQVFVTSHRTKYQRHFELLGKRYTLSSVVMWNGPNTHYYTHACTDHFNNVWHTFDDSNVKKIKGTLEDTIGRHPHLLFYTSESNTFFENPTIANDKIKVLGRIFQSLGDGLKVAQRITNTKLSLYKPILPMTIPKNLVKL